MMRTESAVAPLNLPVIASLQRVAASVLRCRQPPAAISMTCFATEELHSKRARVMLSREGVEGVRQAVDAAEELKMPDPEPLVAPDEEPHPYPLDALSPTLRAAVTAYQRFGQQPIPLVAGSALSVAALATQGLVNVGRDRNLI